MTAILENIDLHQSNTRARKVNMWQRPKSKGIAWNEQLLYGLLPGFTDRTTLKTRKYTKNIIVLSFQTELTTITVL